MKAEYLLNIRVRDALTKEVFLVPEDTDVERLNEIMLLKQQEEVLVTDSNQKIVGIITTNDLAKSLARGIDRKTKVRLIMTPDVVFMPADKLLMEAKMEMRKLGISRAPVLDEDGNLLGLLTSKSICDGFSSRLEKAVEFHELILDKVKTAVCVLDDRCEILSYNKAFEEMFSPSRIIKMTPSNFLPEPLVERIKKGEHPLEDIFFENKDNRKFTLKTCRFKIAGQLNGVVLCIEEISNVISLIAELDKANYKLSFIEKQMGSLKDAECCFGEVVSKNPQMIKAIEKARKIAPSQAPLLIKGECGTGKEMLAKAVHENSTRKSFPLIKVNCAAIPSNLFENEFFGSEEGDFSGSGRYGKTGLLELADKGTIFIDEIDVLPSEIQIKLLHFLQEQTFFRLGGNMPVHANVRIIAATNKDLESLVREGSFNTELYRRISAITIEIPPLRERCEDIVDLVNTFVREYGNFYNKKINHIAPGVLKIFMDYDWPGNVRELKNVVERMVVLSNNGEITEDVLPGYLRKDYLTVEATAEINDLNKAADIAEKRVILDTLKKYAYNKTKAARALKISRSTLYNKMKEYNLGK
ncbi:MAG TPA: sigma 54-interacting transcriptional regulator [Thermoanaerobacterales bacterium]|nr:sigma 54-interacting transcriptional regulator [Thermoanaerobacterales bacterium]